MCIINLYYTGVAMHGSVGRTIRRLAALPPQLMVNKQRDCQFDYVSDLLDTHLLQNTLYITLTLFPPFLFFFFFFFFEVVV